ncbi:hypothetical protein QQF64_033048 [Cirrhinus molitorella]|uniref:Uncharacterized protein n=1 Tax=Cirrhinus molitorella TaxID=172907 RepID=A0ABR3MSY7_9TELE
MAGPTLQYTRESWQTRQWTLISEASFTSPLRHGSEFQLKSSDFSLVVTSKAIPHLKLIDHNIIVRAYWNEDLQPTENQVSSWQC